MVAYQERLGGADLDSCDGPVRRRHRSCALDRLQSGSPPSREADAVPLEPEETALPQLEDRYRGRAALMNGITISAGSGTVGPSFGGLRTVTQPTLVVIAIATFDSG